MDWARSSCRPFERGCIFRISQVGVRNSSARGETLALMPTDASAVLFVDFSELRQAPFFAQLYAWVPKLKRMRIMYNSSKIPDSITSGILIAWPSPWRSADKTLLCSRFSMDGSTGRKSPHTHRKNGSAVKTGGHEIFSVSVSGTAKKISFAFFEK